MLINLLYGLAELGTFVTIWCRSKDDLSPSMIHLFDRYDNISVRVCGGSHIRFVNEQVSCLRENVSTDATLFPNYFVPPLVPRRMGRRIVVLHDLQYRHFPAYFSQRKRMWLRAAHRLALAQADRMVVISEFVRQDAIRCLGESASSKLTVIPNPISWNRFGVGHDSRPMERPYILSVAAHYPHKNLIVLLQAFVQVARREPDLQLVLCGQHFSRLHGVAGINLDIAAAVAELGLQDRVVATGYIDDLELGRWYGHASGFVFPSLFEGFGMPAVEALGFGLPTITTKKTAMPETTRGLASYIDDPLDVDEWASKMLALVRHPELFKPPAANVVSLRNFYEPVRIAGLYAQTCFA